MERAPRLVSMLPDILPVTQQPPPWSCLHFSREKIPAALRAEVLVKSVGQFRCRSRSRETSDPVIPEAGPALFILAQSLSAPKYALAPIGKWNPHLEGSLRRRASNTVQLRGKKSVQMILLVFCIYFLSKSFKSYMLPLQIEWTRGKLCLDTVEACPSNKGLLKRMSVLASGLPHLGVPPQDRQLRGGPLQPRPQSASGSNTEPVDPAPTPAAQRCRWTEVVRAFGGWIWQASCKHVSKCLLRVY